jgi:4,5-dihydroxyphthalate decarboxylase
MAKDIELTLMLADYHRTRPLLNGEVSARGIKLQPRRAESGEACMRPVYEEFDIAEMSLSWYMMARYRNEPVIALPIFPLRMQIHPYIFCAASSGIEGPEDLKGKKIGMDEYRLTVGLWARGFSGNTTGCGRKNASGSRRRPNKPDITRLRVSI